MKFTIPHQLRIALYIFTAIGTPIVAYLFDGGIIGVREVALWGAEVMVISTMAAFNVQTDQSSVLPLSAQLPPSAGAGTPNTPTTTPSAPGDSVQPMV